MTLVRNHQRLLSGSKALTLVIFLSFMASCSVFQPMKKPPSIPKPEKPIEPKEEVKEEVEKVEVSVNKVMLLLPFQLHKVAGTTPNSADVKRAEMPLDFYQGFKLALDNLSKEGTNFELNVIDTRDNAHEASVIGRTSDIQAADLIVGPIFPNEITAFANTAKLNYSLQVSPLAASKPSSFMINNLVSLASPINQHADGLAAYLLKKIRKKDRLIIYSSSDAESDKFLKPLVEKLEKEDKILTYASSMEDLENKLSSEGRNYIINASLNKFSVDAMLVGLVDLKYEMGYNIQLIGHPNWIRMRFQEANLKELNTLITTNYYVDENSGKVLSFKRNYKEAFKIEPTEFSYKGFDTGYFFGAILAKYGPEYAKYLTQETYKGLQTSYTFEHDPRWGYVNTFIQILEFDGYEYQPIN